MQRRRHHLAWSVVLGALASFAACSANTDDHLPQCPGPAAAWTSPEGLPKGPCSSEPDCERSVQEPWCAIDAYRCTCAGGTWSCSVEYQGGGYCVVDASPFETGPDTGRDTGSESGSDGANGCCPPSPHPGCCMSYGGSRVAGVCGTACDGMPQPDDPGWTLVPDSNGCPRWTNPKDGELYPGICGSADSGAGDAAGE